MIFEEKRAFKRVPVNIDARFFCTNMFYSGKISNLSETGMFIITEQPALTGTELSIRLALDQRMVIMRGAVVWMRKDHHVGRGNL